MKRFKKLLAVVLSVMMVVCMIPAMGVAAEDVVAKIGDTEYTTFADAFTAAKAMTGAVTVEIYGDVEFVNGMELKDGSYDSITFIGKENAKITINQSAGGDYLEAHNKMVAFVDLPLAKANPAWSGNSGHMGNYFSIQGGKVTYTNCTFLNGACTSGGTAVYNNCVFMNDTEYGLWVYDDADVTVDGGFIESAKGIKVYSEDETTVTSTLKVQNATFEAAITKKPAIAIGYAAAITLIGNTYNNTTGVLELDSGSDANCEGIAFVAQDAAGNDIADTLTAVDRSNNAPCGVLMDGKLYTTVTTAAADAESGDVLTVLYNSNEEVALDDGVSLNTNGYTVPNVTGSIIVPAPNGNILRAPYLDADSGRIYVNMGGLVFEESVVLELYSGETLLTKATLNTTKYPAGSYKEFTGSIGVEDQNSTSWVVDAWVPLDSMVPTKVELVVDGDTLDSKGIITKESYLLEQYDYITAEDWTAFPGTLESVPTPPAPVAPITPFIPRLENFATTTGEFLDEVYYGGRAAREGDVVLLKVSTSEMGDKYGLNYKNLTVKYETVGAVQLGENYDYNGNSIYKDGMATLFQLSKGTNTIVAKVYYNGCYVGAFDPFFTFVN